jgi:hypothetical protein
VLLKFSSRFIYLKCVLKQPKHIVSAMYFNNILLRQGTQCSKSYRTMDICKYYQNNYGEYAGLDLLGGWGFNPPLVCADPPSALPKIWMWGHVFRGSPVDKSVATWTWCGTLVCNQVYNNIFQINLWIIDPPSLTLFDLRIIIGYFLPSP